jgi:hypothetical protein
MYGGSYGTSVQQSRYSMQIIRLLKRGSVVKLKRKEYIVLIFVIFIFRKYNKGVTIAVGCAQLARRMRYYLMRLRVENAQKDGGQMKT